MGRKTKHVGLLGGTFDPIHNGHLCMAEYVFHRARLDILYFIPNGAGAHRRHPPIAQACDRARWVQMALVPYAPCFVLNDLEIECTQPCHTIDTVQAFYRSNQHLYWIIGEDSFFSLHTWPGWQELSRYVHFIVMRRANHDRVSRHHVSGFYTTHLMHDWNEVRRIQCGTIVECAHFSNPVSATNVRKQIREKRTALEIDIPFDVYCAIQKKETYMH